jgi:hypothetical protein
MKLRLAPAIYLGFGLLIAAACGNAPLTGSHVELDGWFVPKAAADPTCISFAWFGGDGHGRAFNLVSLPADTSWDPERGLIDQAGAVLVGPTGWARVEGRVVDPREECPGTGLEAEAIESIAPLENQWDEE